MTPHPEDELKAKIAALLGAVGSLKIERLPTSGNNRLYLVDSGTEKYVAKHYFTHAEDKRNRLHAEYSFVSFAFRSGIDCLPRPIAQDERNNLAVYSFVEGRKPDLPDVTGTAVKEALDFLVKLNSHRGQAAEDLPNASESCFSIEAHMALIDKRIDRLSGVTDPHAEKFIREELATAWGEIKKEIQSESKSHGILLGDALSKGDRIISPSDFGFHNSIIGADGKFVFLDFEYAGWDDPAKTVGDFFSHLALPVPVEHLGMFAKSVAAMTTDPVRMFVRIGLLLRLYRIKWCCIALNHFLSMDGARRRFAGHDVDQAKEEQLAKARRLLDSMENLKGACHGIH